MAQIREFTSTNASYFILDGVKYPKSYEAVDDSSLNTDRLKVIPIGRTGEQLLYSTHYKNVRVNGNSFTSLEQAISAINEVVFSKGGGSGDGGTTAYEIAVLNGFQGTEAEWLISLKGADGEDFTYEDFTPEQIDNLRGENVSRSIKTGRNKLNPEKALLNTYMTSGGGFQTGNALAEKSQVTDFIPVVSNQTIYIDNSFNGDYGFNVYVFYNVNKIRISGGTKSISNKSLLIPDDSNIKFVRLNLPNENDTTRPNVYHIKEIGIFYDFPKFEYFKEGYSYYFTDNANIDLKDEKSQVTLKDLDDFKKKDYKLNYSYLGNGNLMLNSGENRMILSVLSQSDTVSNVFNFSGYKVGNLDWSNQSDDAAPLYIAGTLLGGNHGWAHSKCTINSHGLTNVDVGTIFTQGENSFCLIRIYDANVLGFVNVPSGTLEVPLFIPVANGTISRGISSYTVTYNITLQIYPTVKNISIRVLADGVEKMPLENGKAKILDIVESYEIMHIHSILADLISKAGNSNPPIYNGSGFIKVHNNYKFHEDLSCIVNSTMSMIGASKLNYITGSQTQILGNVNDGSVSFYIPNSNPLNMVCDFRKPKAIIWGGSTPYTAVLVDNQPEPLNPPHRVIQYKGNVGYMIGYDISEGNYLANLTTATFEIKSNTGKTYPHPVEGMKIGEDLLSGEAISTSIYRAYCDLDKTRTAQRLSVFTLPISKGLLVFVDYSASINDLVKLENSEKYNGKKIKVIESKNCVLKGTIYIDGFYTKANYVEGQTSYLIVLIY